MLALHKKIGHVYNKLEEYSLVFSLIITVLLIFYQIIMRYVFNNSQFWTEELARYIFMWQIWLGASIGLRERKHIKIEMLTGRLKGKIKTGFSLISNLILFGFCLFLVVEGKQFLNQVVFLKMVTPALRIPFLLVYGSLPFSALIICIRLIGIIKNDIKAIISTTEDIEGRES